MGIYWYAINYNELTYFEAPKSFGFNKGDCVFHPDNPFPQMLVMMNSNDDYHLYKDVGNYFELVSDQYSDCLKGHKWECFKNITEEVYQCYLLRCKEFEKQKDNEDLELKSLLKKDI